jgi:hypothetical protein
MAGTNKWCTNFLHEEFHVHELFVPISWIHPTKQGNLIMETRVLRHFTARLACIGSDRARALIVSIIQCNLIPLNPKT